jgi:hypothetical protein
MPVAVEVSRGAAAGSARDLDRESVFVTAVAGVQQNGDGVLVVGQNVKPAVVPEVSEGEIESRGVVVDRIATGGRNLPRAVPKAIETVPETKSG